VVSTIVADEIPLGSSRGAPLRRRYGRSPTGRLTSGLANLEALLQATPIEKMDPDSLQATASVIREAQQLLSSALTRVAMATNRLAEREPSAGHDTLRTLLGTGHVRGSTARKEQERAQVAGALDLVAEAVIKGRVGAEQLDSLARGAKRLSPEQRHHLNTADLVDAAERLPADVFDRRIRDTVERLQSDHGLAETSAKQAASTWRHWFDRRTGMGHVHGEFDPERYESIVNRVEQQLTRLANKGEVQKDHHLAATAAYELLTGVGSRTGSGLPHISVVIDHLTLTKGSHSGSIHETAGGHRLPPQSISRLFCEATVQRVVLDNRRVPIEVGRKHRTATDGQWQAIRAIYLGCAWPACDRPLSWCQLHHIREWEHGGATDLCNLVPLCNHHHHQVHEGGWRVKLHADRRLDILRPDRTGVATTYPDRAPRSAEELELDGRNARGDPGRPP
jgi:hypothetical protein